MAGAATLIGMATVAASTSISISDGGCSGGGSSFCYSPESASAVTGDTVTWNGSGHTATLCDAAHCAGAPSSSASCDHFNVDVNGSGSFTFTHAGTCYYYCQIHGYAAMHAVITVSQAAPPSPTPTPTPPPTAPPTAPPATPPVRAHTPPPSSAAAQSTAAGTTPSSAAGGQATPPGSASPSATSFGGGLSTPSSSATGAVGATAGASPGGSFPILVPVAVVLLLLAGAAFLLVRGRTDRGSPSRDG